MLSAIGVPQFDICRVIKKPDGKPIGIKTLRKHFRDQLDSAEMRANAMVAGSLYKKATDKAGGAASVTAAIFWLKTRAGWKEKQVMEHTGEISIVISSDDAKL